VKKVISDANKNGRVGKHFMVGHGLTASESNFNFDFAEGWATVLSWNTPANGAADRRICSGTGGPLGANRFTIPFRWRDCVTVADARGGRMVLQPEARAPDVKLNLENLSGKADSIFQAIRLSYTVDLEKD
jgi:hypothetical protein